MYHHVYIYRQVEVSSDTKRSALLALMSHFARDHCRMRPKTIIFCRSRLSTVVVQAYMALRLNGVTQNGPNNLARVPSEFIISSKQAAGVLGKLAKQSRKCEIDFTGSAGRLESIVLQLY